MPGFDFRYRLSGGTPTVHTLAVSPGVVLTRGDMLTVVDGVARMAVTGGPRLLGSALEAVAAGSIRVVTDEDAVYAVSDPNARRRGAALDLAGETGAQGIATATNGQLSVVADSTSGQPTLVRISEGRHHGVPATEATPLVGGELNAAITRAVVRLHREHTGRGPTRAQTFYRGNLVIVVMRDALTRAESSLVGTGRAGIVLAFRKELQDTMRADLIRVVEGLTGCTVDAFMSANHVDPDMAAEVFVMDRPIHGDVAEHRET